jgi:hypothetical protein
MNEWHGRIIDRNVEHKPKDYDVVSTHAKYKCFNTRGAEKVQKTRNAHAKRAFIFFIY